MTATASTAGPDAGEVVVSRWLVPAAGVAVLAVLTVWLRFRPIGVSSLWFDDAWVGVGARFPEIGDTIRAGLTAPGFSLVYRAWSTVFGESAEAAQLLALGFAVATPIVLFLAALERGLPAYAAFFGGGLLATAPGHIDMSSHLKQYTAEALATTAVLWAAWRVLDRPAASGRWAAFAAVAIAAGFLSSIGVLVGVSALTVCLVSALLARPRRLRAPVVASGVYALLVGPWLLFAVRPNVHDKLVDYWRGHYLDGAGFAGGLVPRLEALARSFQDTDSRLALLGLLGAAVIVVVRRPLVGALLVLPTVVAVALAALTIVPLGTGATGAYQLSGRTDVYLFPTYALLVAVAIAEVAKMLPARSRNAFGILVVAAFLVVALAAPRARVNGYPQENLTPLVEAVERLRAPGDQIVVYPSAGYAYGIATRYPIELQADARAPTDWVVNVRGPNIDVLPPQRSEPHQWARQLDQIAAGARRIWLIASHHLFGSRLHKDWDVLTDMLFARGYRAKLGRTRPGAHLILYVLAPASVPVRPVSAPSPSPA